MKFARHLVEFIPFFFQKHLTTNVDTLDETWAIQRGRKSENLQDNSENETDGLIFVEFNQHFNWNGTIHSQWHPITFAYTL